MLINVSHPTILEELERIRHLPQSTNGPIADTYERLQGIVFLRAAAIPSEGLDAVTRIFIAFHQCEALALFNVADLITKAAQTLQCRKDGAVDQASHDMRWAYEILKIARELRYRISLLDKHVDVKVKSCASSHVSREFNESLIRFDTVTIALIEDQEARFSASVEFGYFHDAYSDFSHLTKQFMYLAEAHSVHLSSGVSEDFLQANVLREAVHSLNTRNRSLLMQFRLFHQIPEVLAIYCCPLLDKVYQCIVRRQFRAGAESLYLLNMSLEIVLQSIWPLVDLMFPSEYYRIRGHLGQTSGSHSKELGLELLKNRYLVVSKIFYASQAENNLKRGRYYNIFMTEMNRLTVLVGNWRELHLMLPRSILGEDVTSLIGSKAAYRTALAMKSSFEAKDPLSRMQKPASTIDESSVVLRADSKLNELTGRISKRRFPHVEQRTGFFAKR